MARRFKKYYRHRNRFARFCRKLRKRNRHHLKNKCRGGTDCTENILWMDIEKHNHLHAIFKNSDPEYIIMVLDRMMDMKHYRRFRGVRLIRQQELMATGD